MKAMKKRHFIVLILSVFLLWVSEVFAEPTQLVENLRRENVLLPSSAPTRSDLALMKCVTVTRNSQIIGWVAFYDDPKTKRPVDYLELYDGSGGLLLVGWIDRFGITRTAVDQGLLLEEDAAELEGVLALLPEGISL